MKIKCKEIGLWYLKKNFFFSNAATNLQTITIRFYFLNKILHILGLEWVLLVKTMEMQAPDNLSAKNIEKAGNVCYQ